MRAKLCGITTLDDALFASQQDVWALGFNFYSKSPRCISPEKAHDIIAQLPSEIIKIGIFIGCSYDDIQNHLNHIPLDFAQVYEDIACSPAAKQRMILSLSAVTEAQLPSSDILSSYGYVLLDAPRGSDGLLGGTGRQANWDLAYRLAQHYRLILAGGLNVNNIRQAVKAVNPFAVDVASGIECRPGVKDHQLIQHFLEGVHHDK